MGTSEAICSAIDGRCCLMLIYRNYSRVVEPYVLGVDSQGTEVLCAYQVGGGDEASAPIGWKKFEVAAIRGAAVLGERFSAQRPPGPDLRALAETRRAVSAASVPPASRARAAG